MLAIDRDTSRELSEQLANDRDTSREAPRRLGDRSGGLP